LYLKSDGETSINMGHGERPFQETEFVMRELFDAIESTVTAYGPGALKVARRVGGTAFFPGGIGLWRGLEPSGQVPRYFPESPIMFLGHNFDKVAVLEKSYSRGIERMDGPTWLVLRRYLQMAKVDEADCFFTNVFVGLQPKRSIGTMVADDEYRRKCRVFLQKQIDRVRPRFVATLGKHAAEPIRSDSL
jgi:hypothetical protein